MKWFSITLKILFLGALIVALVLKPVWSSFLNSGTHVVAVLINFLIFAFSANLIVLFFSWLYRSQKRFKSDQVDNVILGLQNIYYLLITGGVFLTIFAFLGIDYLTLFTSLSIIAAAIAIISKDFIAEIISGIIISFSREVSIDDYVKIGEHKGKITDIHLTKIALLNDDDDVIFIPNHQVFTSDIINYTKKQIKKVSIEFEIPVQSVKTIEELERDLMQTLSDYYPYIEKNTFNLKIVEIRKDSLSLKFQYVFNRIDRELEREIRRKTVRRVVNYVKTNLQSVREGTVLKS